MARTEKEKEERRKANEEKKRRATEFNKRKQQESKERFKRKNTSTVKKRSGGSRTIDFTESSAGKIVSETNEKGQTIARVNISRDKTGTTVTPIKNQRTLRSTTNARRIEALERGNRDNRPASQRQKATGKRLSPSKPSSSSNRQFLFDTRLPQNDISTNNLKGEGTTIPPGVTNDPFSLFVSASLPTQTLQTTELSRVQQAERKVRGKAQKLRSRSDLTFADSVALASSEAAIFSTDLARGVKDEATDIFKLVTLQADPIPILQGTERFVRNPGQTTRDSLDSFGQTIRQTPGRAVGTLAVDLIPIGAASRIARTRKLGKRVRTEPIAPISNPADDLIRQQTLRQINDPGPLGDVSTPRNRDLDRRVQRIIDNEPLVEQTRTFDNFLFDGNRRGQASFSPSFSSTTRRFVPDTPISPSTPRRPTSTRIDTANDLLKQADNIANRRITRQNFNTRTRNLRDLGVGTGASLLLSNNLVSGSQSPTQNIARAGVSSPNAATSSPSTIFDSFANSFGGTTSQTISNSQTGSVAQALSPSPGANVANRGFSGILPVPVAPFGFPGLPTNLPGGGSGRRGSSQTKTGQKKRPTRSISQSTIGIDAFIIEQDGSSEQTGFFQRGL